MSLLSPRRGRGRRDGGASSSPLLPPAAAPAAVGLDDASAGAAGPDGGDDDSSLLSPSLVSPYEGPASALVGSPPPRPPAAAHLSHGSGAVGSGSGAASSAPDPSAPRGALLSDLQPALQAGSPPISPPYYRVPISPVRAERDDLAVFTRRCRTVSIIIAVVATVAVAAWLVIAFAFPGSKDGLNLSPSKPAEDVSGRCSPSTALGGVPTPVPDAPAEGESSGLLSALKAATNEAAPSLLPLPAAPANVSLSLLWCGPVLGGGGYSSEALSYLFHLDGQSFTEKDYFSHPHTRLSYDHDDLDAKDSPAAAHLDVRLPALRVDALARHIGDYQRDKFVAGLPLKQRKTLMGWTNKPLGLVYLPQNDAGIARGLVRRLPPPPSSPSAANATVGSGRKAMRRRKPLGPKVPAATTAADVARVTMQGVHGFHRVDGGGLTSDELRSLISSTGVVIYSGGGLTSDGVPDIEPDSDEAPGDDAHEDASSDVTVGAIVCHASPGAFHPVLFHTKPCPPTPPPPHTGAAAAARRASPPGQDPREEGPADAALERAWLAGLHVAERVMQARERANDAGARAGEAAEQVVGAAAASNAEGAGNAGGFVSKEAVEALVAMAAAATADADAAAATATATEVATGAAWVWSDSEFLAALSSIVAHLASPKYAHLTLSTLPPALPSVHPSRAVYTTPALLVARTMFETDTIPADWVGRLKKFDQVWVPTSALKAIFTQQPGGLPRGLVRVVPEGVDTKAFAPGQRQKKAWSVATTLMRSQPSTASTVAVPPTAAGMGMGVREGPRTRQVLSQGRQLLLSDATASPDEEDDDDSLPMGTASLPLFPALMAMEKQGAFTAVSPANTATATEDAALARTLAAAAMLIASKATSPVPANMSATLGDDGGAARAFALAAATAAAPSLRLLSVFKWEERKGWRDLFTSFLDVFACQPLTLTRAALRAARGNTTRAAHFLAAAAAVPASPARAGVASEAGEWAGAVQGPLGYADLFPVPTAKAAMPVQESGSSVRSPAASSTGKSPLVGVGGADNSPLSLLEPRRTPLSVLAAAVGQGKLSLPRRFLHSRLTSASFFGGGAPSTPQQHPAQPPALVVLTSIDGVLPPLSPFAKTIASGVALVSPEVAAGAARWGRIIADARSLLADAASVKPVPAPVAAAAAAALALPLVLLPPAQLPQTSLPQLYRACDAFVLPTRGEGWGRPHTEALATGLPVVTTFWSGPTEFLSEASGYPLPVAAMEPAHDAPKGHKWARPSLPALAAAMADVTRAPLAAATRGRAGRERMVKDFCEPCVAAVAAEALARGVVGRDVLVFRRMVVEAAKALDKGEGARKASTVTVG